MSRIIIDIPTNGILQVEKTPELNVAQEFGGRYTIPVPDGTGFDFDELPVAYTPQDIADQLAAKLLARFPMYSNITYNFLLDAVDVLDLDLAATPAVSPVGGWTPLTRTQTGRSSALPGPSGQVPTTTSILPINATKAPNRPGMLISDTIDIGPVTAGAGADEFLVWWQIYTVNTTHDVTSDFGTFAGSNVPAGRQIFEIDQEPVGFTAYISHDDGVTWTATGRLEPTDLVTFNTNVRIAFVNTTGTKYIVAAYAILF